jgi:hypothetical protein
MVKHSHRCSSPSARKTIVKLIAAIKKIISRTKTRLLTLNSRTRAMEPATTAVMKPAAPISSPTAILPLLEPIAAKVLKTSGEPFPKARKVTPARLSLSPSTLEMVLRLTLKKSLAAMPMVVKSRPSHTARMAKATGFTLPKVQ